MTDFTTSIVVDQVIDALAAFLTNFMQGGEIIRAQVNRVPMPNAPCAVLTELLLVDIDTPYQDYDTTLNKVRLHGPQRIDVQIDFYGTLSAELNQVVKTAFRTEWASSQFPDNIKPLYANDGIQAPLVTGEQQYENRWTLTVSLQYNPIITVPQQFADVATVAYTKPVDVFETL